MPPDEYGDSCWRIQKTALSAAPPAQRCCPSRYQGVRAPAPLQLSVQCISSGLTDSYARSDKGAIRFLTVTRKRAEGIGQTQNDSSSGMLSQLLTKSVLGNLWAQVWADGPIFHEFKLRLKSMQLQCSHIPAWLIPFCIFNFPWCCFR